MSRWSLPLLLALGLPRTAEAWSEVQLHTDAGAGIDHRAPDLARTGWASYAVFHSNRLKGSGSSDHDLFLVCSLNNGQTWSAPTPIKATTGLTELFPKVAAVYVPADDRIRVHVAYKSGGTATLSADGNLGYLRFAATRDTPCALSSEADAILTSGSAEDVNSGDLDADRAGNAYLIWRDKPGATFRVKFGAVAAGAATLDPAGGAPLTDGIRNALRPQIAARGPARSSATVVGVWDEDPGNAHDLVLCLSTNGGEAWSRAVLDEGVLLADAVRDGSVAIQQTNFAAFLAYRKGADSDDDVVVRRVTRAAGTIDWGSPVVVSAGPPVDEPHVSAIYAHPLAVVGWTSNEGSNEALATYTTNGGASWRTPATIHPGSNVRAQQEPRVAAGSAFAVFESDRDAAGDFEVFFSADTGPTALPLAHFDVRRVEDRVEVTGSLLDPGRVAAMELLRGRDDQWEAVAAPAAGLDGSFRWTDHDPPIGAGYLLRLWTTVGDEQTFGPFFPETPGNTQSGCGCQTAEAAGSLPLGLFPLWVVARRYRACGRRRRGALHSRE